MFFPSKAQEMKMNDLKAFEKWVTRYLIWLDICTTMLSNIFPVFFQFLLLFFLKFQCLFEIVLLKCAIIYRAFQRRIFLTFLSKEIYSNRILNFENPWAYLRNNDNLISPHSRDRFFTTPIGVGKALKKTQTIQLVFFFQHLVSLLSRKAHKTCRKFSFVHRQLQLLPLTLPPSKPTIRRPPSQCICFLFPTDSFTTMAL